MCNQSELKIEYVVGHPNILQTFKYDSACTSARVHLLNMTHLPRGRFSNALSAISSLSVKALENVRLSFITLKNDEIIEGQRITSANLVLIIPGAMQLTLMFSLAT